MGVAIKFSGPVGTVITFDNPWNESLYCCLRGWDCSWMSRFKEEDERLFFGGFWMTKVVNIRLIETKENLKKFVKAIYHFDTVLNGGDLRFIKNNSDFSIIKNLIRLSLKMPSKVSLHPFIIGCFIACIQNKQQIVFELNQLFVNGDWSTNDFLFYSWPNKHIKRKDNDFSNLIRPEIFSIFPEVKTLIIQSHSYSFSLTAFLKVISR